MSSLSIPNAISNGISADGNDVGANFTAIQNWADTYVVESSALRYQVCTSGARPTPVDGLMIYETDTDRVRVYDGTDWLILTEPAQSWTPSWTGITVGSGTNEGYYRRQDGWVDFYARFVYGSGSSIGAGTTELTLPFQTHGTYDMVIDVMFRDSGTDWYHGAWRPNTASSIELEAFNTSGTYLYGDAVNTTTPFTWTTNDSIYVRGRYRMSNKYA